MSEHRPNEDVEIIVLPEVPRKRLSAMDRKKIRRVIRDNLLLTSKEQYRKVQVEVMRQSDGTPKSLVASMLRTTTYTADIIKVNVDSEYNAISIEPLPTGT